MEGAAVQYLKNFVASVHSGSTSDLYTTPAPTLHASRYLTYLFSRSHVLVMSVERHLVFADTQCEMSDPNGSATEFCY